MDGVLVEYLVEMVGFDERSNDELDGAVVLFEAAVPNARREIGAVGVVTILLEAIEAADMRAAIASGILPPLVQESLR